MITFSPEDKPSVTLIILWILAPDLHRTPRGKFTTFIDNIHPPPSGNLKESATGNKDRLCRVS